MTSPGCSNMTVSLCEEETRTETHAEGTMWRHGEKVAVYKPGERPADTVIYSQALWENEFLFVKPPRLWYLVTTALTNQDTPWGQSRCMINVILTWEQQKSQNCLSHSASKWSSWDSRAWSLAPPITAQGFDTYSAIFIEHLLCTQIFLRC